MPRPVSAVFQAAVNAQETGEVFTTLVTIDHAALPVPLRATDDAVNVLSRGATFLAYPFELELPDDNADRPPEARIAIDNVDREIVAAIRAVGSPPTVTIEVVLASDPDTVEASFDHFELTDARYDRLVVEGRLSLPALTLEPYPRKRFLPSAFPGAFA